MGLKAYNPNSFAVSLVRHDLAIEINSRQVGTAKSQKKYRIGSDETKEFQFEVSTSLKSLISGGIGMLPQLIVPGKEMDIRVSGIAKVKVWGICRKIPVDYETSFRPEW